MPWHFSKGISFVLYITHMQCQWMPAADAASFVHRNKGIEDFITTTIATTKSSKVLKYKNT